jgi:integrase
MDLLRAGRFIVHHRMQHPATLGPDDVAAFLTTLATRDRVSASTQNQALSALLFLYAHVIRQPLGALPVVIRVHTPTRLPLVFTRDEVRQVLRQLEGVPRLLAALLYGSGLRLLEALSLRVKDVDLERQEITVRQGKGRKDRKTPLPSTLTSGLRAHLETVKRQHDADLGCGLGRVALPDGLDVKYPNAGRSWPWQFAFPAARSAAIRAGARPAASICTSPSSSVPSPRPCALPASPSGAAAAPCATRSRRTCSRTATISAPRNCSDTLT